jgi:hypothetical protein
MEMVQMTMPKPLPKGVSVVYDQAAQAFLFRTDSMTAAAELVSCICESTCR